MSTLCFAATSARVLFHANSSARARIAEIAARVTSDSHDSSKLLRIERLA